MSDSSGERQGSITVAISDFRRDGSREAFEILFAYYKKSITKKADHMLRYNQSAMQESDDVINIIMSKLASELKKEDGWVVEKATNRDALLKIIGRMSFFRCCKILRTERARPAIRASDISSDENGGYELFIDPASVDWDADLKMTLDEIEDGLRKLNAGFRGEDLVCVFKGMQLGRSNVEMAAAIGKSLQTVTRIKRIIRTFAAKLLKLNQEKQFDDD